MRVVHLTAKIEKDNKVSVDLEPVDMDNDPDKFFEEAEYIMGTDKLMRTNISVHGQEFVAIYDPSSLKPPSLHTPEGFVLCGDVLVGAKFGDGALASLSGGGEKFIYQHLEENIREAMELSAKK